MLSLSRHIERSVRVLIALSFLLVSCSSAIETTNVVITFAAPKDERVLYEPMMAEFHKQHPGIVVQFVALDEGINPLASLGDVILLGNLSLNPQNQFLNLQSWLDNDEAFDANDFWPGALDACQDRQGNPLGIPLWLTVYGVFYQKVAFDALQLVYPAAGWTWNDFRQTVAALAKSENGKVIYGFVDDSRSPLLLPYLDRLLLEQSGEIVPETLVGELDWYVKLAQENKLYPVQERGTADWRERYSEWVALFENGQAAMWVGPYGESTAASNGFAPFPGDDQTRHSTPVYADCAAISAGTRYPQEAWNWLEFLSHHPPINGSGVGVLPVRQSIAIASGFWQELTPDIQQMLRFSLSNGWYHPENPDELDTVMAALSSAIAQNTSLFALLSESLSSIKRSPQPTLPVATVVVQTPEPTVSVERTTLRYFASGARHKVDLDRHMTALIIEYEHNHPDVKILYEFAFPNFEGNSWEVMSKTYDCFSWGTPDWGIIPTDSLLNLTPLIEAEDAAFIQDYPKFMLDVFRSDTGLYGLPAEGDVEVMAYNADLLAKRGIEIPLAGWTFDDFINRASLASSKSESDPSYGFLSLEYDLLFAGRGLHWPELTDSSVAEFDTPGAANILKWLQALETSGVILPTAFIPPDFEMRKQAIQSGQVAFWTTSISAAGLGYFSDQPPTFQIGILPLPTSSNGEALIFPQVTHGHYISSQSEQIPACWDWIKLLSQQTELFGGLPARKSVAFSPAWEAKVGSDSLEIYQTSLAKSEGRTLPKSYAPIEIPFYSWRADVLQRISQGEDIQQVLAQTQAEVDAYTSCLANSDLSGIDAGELFQFYVLPCLNNVRPDLARGLGFGL